MFIHVKLSNCSFTHTNRYRARFFLDFLFALLSPCTLLAALAKLGGGSEVQKENFLIFFLHFSRLALTLSPETN